MPRQIGRALDSLIGVVSPRWALSRMQARATMAQIETFTGGASGYEAGKNNRLTKAWARARLTENQVPRAQLEQLDARSWDLYRNNPHARKIVRTILAKVIGRGMQPQSQAIGEDGRPHVEFRRRAQQLWKAASKRIDYRGRPGYGGQSLVGLQKTALRKTILSGDALAHLRPIDLEEMRRRGSPAPLVLQLVDPLRLDSSLTTHGKNAVHGGIEINAAGERVAYWLFNEDFWRSPVMNWVHGRLSVSGNSEPVPADQIAHLYAGDDVDQVRGTSWFAPALMQMRNTADYEFNELTASAIAACATIGVRRSRGSSGIGLELPAEWDTTDPDGNRYTSMQPGMIVDLGNDGSLEGFNPQRPNATADAWIQHMLRTTAASQPGVKSSTLTGDYRNSSFSSERSADNDAWPELEDLQDWFAESFCQPLYEALVRMAVVTGWFDGVITPGEFLAREEEFLGTTWQGPVARSINPADDAKASKMRVQNGTSSPQIEAANLGRNWRDLLDDVAEYLDYGRELGIPQDVLDQSLGIEQTDAGAAAEEDAEEGGKDEKADEQNGQSKAAA